MIRDLTDLAKAAAAGALVLGACSGDKDADDSGTTDTPDTEDTGPMTGCPTTACPTTACPTTACPTTACPTTACPTAVNGPGAFAEDWQTSPDFFTAMAAPIDGGSVHGVVQIWYSTNIQAWVESEKAAFTAPDGTVSIKTVNGGKEVMTMIKVAGSDPANNDWFYERRAGTAPYAVIDDNQANMGGCIKCHAGFAATDYLGGIGLR